MKIGIMGGTMNPIHLAHLMIAEHIKEDFNLDKIYFIPTGDPPHKKLEVSSEKRYEMTVIATSDNRDFEVLDIESKREGKSFTVDTMTELSKTKDEYYFIIGTDTLFLLRSWKNFEKISKLTRFIVATRPDYDDDLKIHEEIDNLKKEFGLEIYLASIPRYEISSTDIRNRVKEGRSIKYLVPDDVISYIEKEGLYD